MFLSFYVFANPSGPRRKVRISNKIEKKNALKKSETRKLDKKKEREGDNEE